MLKTLGRYEILGFIARGGSSEVYRALDRKLERQVAVKLLLDEGEAVRQARPRFLNEVRVAAQLRHPAIVPILDFDENDGRPYIVFEYVEGTTLSEVLSSRRLDEAEIVRIGSNVAEGLAHAHARGILHRDIKPSNIILEDDGRARILDFGLAKTVRVDFRREGGDAPGVPPSFTVVGTIVGTPEYMSPEQVAGDELDERTDIFSLGTVLFEMITGVNPFAGKTVASVIGHIMSPVEPSIPEDSTRVSAVLRSIVRRCLEKNREARYRRAAELLEDLHSLRAGRRGNEGSVRGTSTGRQVIGRGVARLSLALLQVLYLTLYTVALLHPSDVLDAITLAASIVTSAASMAGFALTSVLLVSGCCGIPVRLYLLACVGFDHPDTGRQFGRLFPYLVALDEIWALSPFLLAGRWPEGLTLACAALLAYLPISHRNLIRAGYPDEWPRS